MDFGLNGPFKRCLLQYYIYSTLSHSLQGEYWQLNVIQDINSICKLTACLHTVVIVSISILHHNLNVLLFHEITPAEERGDLYSSTVFSTAWSQCKVMTFKLHRGFLALSWYAAVLIVCWNIKPLRDLLFPSCLTIKPIAPYLCHMSTCLWGHPSSYIRSSRIRDAAAQGRQKAAKREPWNDSRKLVSPEQSSKPHRVIASKCHRKLCNYDGSRVKIAFT